MLVRLPGNKHDVVDVMQSPEPPFGSRSVQAVNYQRGEFDDRGTVGAISLPANDSLLAKEKDLSDRKPFGEHRLTHTAAIRKRRALRADEWMRCGHSSDGNSLFVLLPFSPSRFQII